MAPPPATALVVEDFLPVDFLRYPVALARPLLGDIVEAICCLRDELEPTPNNFLVNELINLHFYSTFLNHSNHSVHTAHENRKKILQKDKAIKNKDFSLRE